MHLLPNATDVYGLAGGCGTCTSTRNVYYYTVGLENIKLVLHVARAIFDYSFRYRHTKSAPGRGSRFRYHAASCCNSIPGVSLIKYHFTPPSFSLDFPIVLQLQIPSTLLVSVYSMLVLSRTIPTRTWLLLHYCINHVNATV